MHFVTVVVDYFRGDFGLFLVSTVLLQHYYAFG
jgi:hypothetical protein